MTLTTPRVPKKPRCLVVVLNETRGSSATIGPLKSTGLRNIDATVAYAGAKSEADVNPYAEFADYLWEFDEPESWANELRGLLSQDLFDFFLNPGASDGIVSSHKESQLWVSAWIQIIYRQRALEKILDLGLRDRFDWFIFVRSDYYFSSPISLPNTSSQSGLVFMAGDSYGGLNDRFLAMPAYLVAPVAKAINYVSSRSATQPAELFEFLRQRKARNPETLIWYQLDAAGMLRDIEFICQMGFCVRVKGQGTRWARGYWSEKRKLHIKYPTELMLSKWAPIFQRLSSWESNRLWRGLGRRWLNLAAKVARVAGTQPRILLSPLLILHREFQLGREVFTRSYRRERNLLAQLGRDLRTLIVDFSDVLRRTRDW